MTLKANARTAGATYLLYIALALPATVLFENAARGDGMAARLAGIAHDADLVRVSIVLSIPASFAALVLAVTLYRLTREQDADLAMLGMTCRVGEGVISGATGFMTTLGLLWLASSSSATTGDREVLAAFLFKAQDWSVLMSATFFAVGSMLFSWLLLRGRMIPAAVAWLGVLASVLLVLVLPLRLVGWLAGPLFMAVWLPMLVFELVLAFWLIIKGVAAPVRSQAA